MGALEDGEVGINMADGGIEGDGEGIIGNHAGNHLFHGFAVRVRFIFGELTNDESGNTVKCSIEAQTIEHPLDFIDRFSDIFNEKNRALGAYYIIRSRNEAIEHC